MYRYKIQFLTLKKEIGYIIKSSNRNEVEEVARELTSIYD